MLNMSDSKEELDENKLFLKGGTITALWNDVIICMNLQVNVEQKHEWWNSVIPESRVKRLVIRTVNRIVDANNKSENSWKAQHKRKCGKVKGAKHIREEMLQDLKK